MKILRIFNNNACLVENDCDEEEILLGRGIAFQKKNGESVDDSKIEKKFVFDSSKVDTKFNELFQEIPVKILSLSISIVKMAEELLAVELDQNIYISIADHISFAINRYHKGENIKNILLWDIKKFYPKEFAAALNAVDYINYELSVDLPEDEAGYLAMHIVNAQHTGSQISETVQITNIVNDLLQIVELHFKIKIDEESLNYMRFITHIRYFSRRVFTKSQIESEEKSLVKQVTENYPEAYLCTLKIRKYFAENFEVILNDSEIMYFTLHINRIYSR